MTNPQDVTLVDCTLRDGGYYNEWDFSSDLIEKYLRSVSRANVPIVEIGFRLPADDRFLGAAAYSTDDFLLSLDLPLGPTYGVMVNAKDLLTLASGASGAIDALFDAQQNSPIRLVRIAANYGEIRHLGPAVERLHELGYDVGLNLMKVSMLDTEDLQRFSRDSSQFGIDVAYFADSFGCLRPSDIRPIAESIRSSFDGPLGCHLHDNMALAHANSLAAMDAGVTWVDGTILGMGRGPGNAKTEYLALEMERMGVAKVDDLPLLDIVSDDFASLQAQYGWGTSIYYYLSALHGVHPSYIQELTKDGRYSVEQIVGALDQLSGGAGSSFETALMTGATDRTAISSDDGSWDATDWCAEEEVLIIGAGPEGQRRRHDIEHLIRSRDLRVIALNAVPPIDTELVDRFAICDPVRATIDSDLIAELGSPICLPIGGIGSTLDLGSDIDDYGLAVEPGVFRVETTGCVVPRLEAAAYAIAIASAGGARRILLTGFDGFPLHDPRQDQMVEIFELAADSPQVPEIVALTRTTYPVKQASLYQVQTK